MSSARRGPPLVEAAMLITVVFGLALAAGIIGGPAASLPAVQLLAIGAPVLVYALIHPSRPGPLLGLTRPKPVALLGGVIAGVGVLAINVGAVLPLVFHLAGEPSRPPPAILSGSIAWQLLAVALIPAVCEELVFRGVLARSLARTSAVGAVIGSAAVFAVFHMSLYRLAPTFTVGVITAVCVLRSGSTFVAIAAHLANNAALITLIPYAPTLSSAPPAVIAGCGFLLVGGGLWLIRTNRDQ